MGLGQQTFGQGMQQPSSTMRAMTSQGTQALGQGFNRTGQTQQLGLGGNQGGTSFGNGGNQEPSQFRSVLRIRILDVYNLSIFIAYSKLFLNLILNVKPSATIFIIYLSVIRAYSALLCKKHSTS